MSKVQEDEREGKRQRDGSQISDMNSEGYKRARGDDDGSEIEYIDEDGKKRRAKRRSKNDLDGRDYKCSFCPKTYLSYPALYTHMKTKHSKGSDNPLLLNSGRGRGRPKKNAGRVTTIDPQSDDYFKTLDKGGGPIDPLYYFDRIIHDFFSEEGKARRSKEEPKSQDVEEDPQTKEETKNEDVMPPPVPIGAVKIPEVKEESESQQKASEDTSQNPETSENKSENEDSKSNSDSKRLSDPKKLIFTQFEFQTYNNYKDYPLYHILSKKHLKDTPPNSDLKTEVKEEDNEDEDQEGDKEEMSPGKEAQKSEQPAPSQSDVKSESQNEQSQVENSNVSQNDANMKSESEEPRFGKKRFDQVLEDYENLTFEERKKLSCDEVCGIYLREISQKVNTKFYKTLLRFVILFRECCNEYGWRKIVETEKLLADENIKVDVPLPSVPSSHKNSLQQQMLL